MVLVLVLIMFSFRLILTRYLKQIFVSFFMSVGIKIRFFKNKKGV